MKLLLDTCTFLWMVSDKVQLSENSQPLLIDPNNELFLSPASVWEICVKHKRGGLTLTDPPERFISEQRKMHSIETLPLDEISVLQLPNLPEIHKDPFDRMLICQAIAHGLIIVTPDPMITQYPVRTTW